MIGSMMGRNRTKGFFMDLKSEKWGIPQLMSIDSVMILVLLVALAPMSCATQSTVQVRQPFEQARHHKIHVERCVDRTDYQGKHDLVEEATSILMGKMMASGLFEIEPGSNFVLTCDIERFAEGSAAKRWLMPGWGATQAEVVVMVWDKHEGKVLASFRSEASVKAGGLYTIGADHYIFGAAFDDILQQLKTWVEGKASENPAQEMK
jgi:hypothetical protein